MRSGGQSLHQQHATDTQSSSRCLGNLHRLLVQPTSRQRARRKQFSAVARSSSPVYNSTATADPTPAAASGECPVRHIMEHTESLGLEQQKALLGMQQQRRTPGPAPFSIASFIDVSGILKDGIHKAMLNFSQKYGSVSRFANPSALNAASGWLFVNDPDCVQYLCSTNVRNYGRRYLPDIYKWVTHEKGILGSQDEYNAKHRRLCQPPFRNKNILEKFAGTISDRALTLVDIWRQHGEHNTDLALQTQRLTLDVVGLVAFSHDFGETEQIRRELAGAQAEKEDALLWAVNTFGEILAKVFITPLPMLRFMERLGDPTLKTLTRAVETMRGSMLGVIHRQHPSLTPFVTAGLQQRREALEAGGADTQKDLLGVLLQATDDDGRPMTDEELWEDVHDIMGAGHETTATTTAAVLYCVSVHPEVEARVHEELDRVLGPVASTPMATSQRSPGTGTNAVSPAACCATGADAPSHEQLEQLDYLRACVKEVLRLYPAIPIFPREALADDMLPTGDRVKSGDVVFMSSYALGRSPELWEDTTEFRPERFSKEEEAKLHRFQFLPFGAGPRMCLGAGFAQMSVTLMAATLLQHFRFEAVRPTSKEIPVAYDITMMYPDGLRMNVVPRR